MPEEKKDKKVVPLAPVGNEGKKDSFTFSDKIKNSKPAASKSFANRISSKIGSDGKPKKTLFERTKRDAPFFIAAIAALLLLPFLYKYSGSAGEEPSMVTPGLEGTEFDPTRSGFDTLTGDPENQIAQLSGRDSLSLIKGFGGEPAETSDDLPYRSDLERSGFDDDYGSSSNRTSERNETNITRYRKQAAPATRAAFKKTNINPLRSAGLTSRGGGKLGVGMWGGGLKQAANKVQADAPKSSPKPVSLQPLQAVGKPSRSYFGQGAAAEARRSKDAMSKANAVQALRDAQMRAIEPGKIGGILSGEMGGPGGGNGKLERNFAFNGKEPWWWDMMKQRSQMEWEKKFNYKWGWIDWATGLAQKLADGLLSCVITGTDDWSMGKMFGAPAGVGGGAECCGMNEEKFKGAAPNVEFNPNACKGWVIAHPEVGCTTKWVEAKKNKTSLGPISQRLDCLSNGVFAARKARKASEGLAELGDCNTFYKDGHYTASYSGKYSLYHYIVGVRSADWEKYVNGLDNDRYELLHVGYIGKGATFSVNPEATGQLMNQKAFIPLFIESVAVKNKKVKNDNGTVNPTPNPAIFRGEQQIAEYDPMTGLVDKNGYTHELTYKEFLDKLSDGGLRVGNAVNQESSVLMSVKGGKRGKSWETGARCAYPLAFVSCHDTATAGVDFGDLKTSSNPAAFLSFPNVGKSAAKAASAKDVQKMFRVTYRVENRLNANDAPKGYFVQTIDNTQDYVPEEVLAKNGGREIAAKYNIAASGKGAQAVHNAMGDAGDATKSAAVTWEIRQCWNAETPWSFGRTIADGACGRTWNEKAGGVNAKDLPGIVVSSATCVYGDEGEVVSIEPEPETNCKDGETKVQQNSDGCEEQSRCQGGNWTGWTKTNSDCVCGDGTVQNLPDEPEGCHWQQTCRNNVWVKSMTNPNDPPCKRATPPTPRTKVSFYTDFTKMPDQVLSEQARSNPDSQGGTAWQTCQIADMSNTTIYMDQSTVDFLTQAINSYNGQAKETEMNAYAQQIGDNSAMVAQVVDAMRIMQTVGKKDVPKDTVCAVGKAIASQSRDPQVTDRTNALGSFLAFIDEDSSFYPTNFYRKESESEGTKYRDYRFYGCAGGKVQKYKGTDMSGYHYGLYNWNEEKYGDRNLNGRDREPYSKVLQEGIWKDFPLKALAIKNDKLLFTRVNPERLSESTNKTIDDVNRQQYHKDYQNLLKLGRSCGYGQETMSIADALKYIQVLCKEGAREKPKNGRAGLCGRAYEESHFVR